MLVKGPLVPTRSCITHYETTNALSTVFTFILQGHYSDAIMGAMASQITNLKTFYSTDDSGADQRKHQSSPSLAFVRGIHRGPVN